MNRDIVISAGHGKNISGATGYIDEFESAYVVVAKVTELLGEFGVNAIPFVDNISVTQKENLRRIVDFHNSKSRDLDVSIHFNSYQTTAKPMGTECLYVTQDALAQQVATSISDASGLINRGPKKHTDLYFLNNTEEPAILVEVCFVDSRADVTIYEEKFEEICSAIAQSISGVTVPADAFVVEGRASVFGGPDDDGVAPNEGLAFISSMSQAPHLFLPYQPSGTSGLARRLNPWVHYVACRWDYEQTPKEVLLHEMASVWSSKTDIELRAFPADWGPNENTGRVADLSPSLMDDLGIKTDDEVKIIFPSPS